jgi:hypothetical protein
MQQSHRIALLGVAILLLGMSLASFADNNPGRTPAIPTTPPAVMPANALPPPPVDDPAALRIALLTRKQVCAELKLSVQVVTDLWDVVNDYRKKNGEVGRNRDLSAAERTKKLDQLRVEQADTMTALLNPEQLKRLIEIEYQLRGPQAIADDAVTKALGLEKATQDKIKTIVADARKAGASNAAMQKIRDKRDAAILDLLTEAQKAKWVEIQGAPFKLKYIPTGETLETMPKVVP